jgi:hypothetical protein
MMESIHDRDHGYMRLARLTRSRHTQVPKELAEVVADFIEHGVVTYVTLAKRYMAKRRQERQQATQHKSAL